ncbi:Nn.00g115570.m01.CDS01 [Neocucurbitaria sp. VM-36]
MADKMEGVVMGGGLVDPSKYPVPIETIYVNNLEERVKIDTMKEALTRVFKHYGPILDVIAKSSLKRKGQAFVVFDSEKSALEAVEEMNGFEMYGKVMKVSRAKTHSDETVKRKVADMFDEHKRKRLMLKDFKRAEEDAKAQANPTVAAEKPRAAKTGAAAVPDEYVRPNKTLFLQNIPRDVDEDALTTIFESFEGFKEVRLVSVRSVAFAEFENEQFAITAKEATANTPIGAEGKPMKVTYQRQ